jgi:hypothetical protein
LENHFKSLRHLKEINGNLLKQIKQYDYKCENCGKNYKTNAGLWKHKKTCNYQKDSKPLNVVQSGTQITTELIMELIKDNKEMKQIILEQNTTINNLVKNGINNNINNTYTNSNNKSFNLNFFLNETCKDAMNINDFVDSIKVQLCDLERFGEIGYVENLSNIITSNLKALDITERPVHCTDKKREVLYLKDEDKWEKQSEDSAKLRKVIHKVSDKNIRMISAYKEKHPDCNQSDSRYSDQYAHILIEAMGGPGDNRLEKESKIIKNISKEVVVEKAL